MDRNFKARAISIKPNVTLILFIHPPDFGMELSQPGNAANKAKGKASANENPNIPIKGPTGIRPNKVGPPPIAVSTNSVPIIGPVQEKETSASVNAIKKIPNKPP